MRKHSFFKYLAYALEIIILYVVQYTPNFMPELFGGKPLLLGALALSIASKEKHIPAMILGGVCGALMDLSSGAIGYFSVFLTLACWLEAEVFDKYFVSRFISAFVYGVSAIAVMLSVYFVLFVLLIHTADAGFIFVNHYISRFIYTVVTLLPLYPLNKLINKTFTS